MKKVLSIILALCCLLSFSSFSIVSAAAESEISVSGTSVSAESTDASASELSSAFETLLKLDSLAESYVKSEKKPSFLSSLKSCEVTVDPASVVYTVDSETTVTPSDEGTVTLAPGKHSVSVSFSFHAVYSFSTLGKVSNGEGDFSTSGKSNFTFYVREKTILTVAKTAFTATYGDELSADDLLSEMAPSVTLKDGTAVEVADGEIKIVEKLTNLDAGTHTFTVRFAGRDNGDYTGLDASEATFTLTVKKAASAITVNSAAVAYDGMEHMPEITVTPENVPYIAITAGIQGDATGFASIYMSEGSGLYNALVFMRDSGDALNRIAKLLGIDLSDFIIGSEGLSTAQLRSLLENVGDLADAMKLVGINIDDTQIGGILNAVIAIEKYLPDINVRFYVKNMPKNQGMYVTYAVTSDSNYATAMDFGFTTIAPDFKVKVNWNESITEWKNKSFDGFDFGAYITDSETGEVLPADVNYKITGLTYAGQLFSSNSTDNYPTEPGIYTETAYIVYNYAGTASRTFSIARHASAVKFVNEDGVLTDSLSLDLTYNGQPVEIKAVVVDENGDVIEGAKVNYLYSGKTFSGKTYLSAKAPSGSGTYTVTATFSGDGVYSASSSSGANVYIHKKAATITFESITTKVLQKVDYSTIAYTYDGMTAEEAARIASTLDCNSIHLLIGTHNMKVEIPEDIAEQYDVTVLGAKHTVKLFG